MKIVIVLAALCYSLSIVSAPTGAATEETAAQAAEAAQARVLRRIGTAVTQKNIELIFKWLPSLTDEEYRDAVFESLMQLNREDYTDEQLSKLQQLLIKFRGEYNQLPQIFTLPEIQKKWSPYLPLIYPKKTEPEMKSAPKPAAPNYRAPRPGHLNETVFLIGREPIAKDAAIRGEAKAAAAEKREMFAIPLALARHPNIVGEYISTVLENDPEAREILLAIRPRILAGLVDIFKLAKASRETLRSKPFYEIVNRYTAPEQLEMLQAAHYLDAQHTLQLLAEKYVADHHTPTPELLATLPRDVKIALADAHRDWLKAPMESINLIGSDGKPVAFDRYVLLDQNIVGPIISKLLKAEGKIDTRLPIESEALKLVSLIFNHFYDYLRSHKNDRRALREKAVLAVQGLADELEYVNYRKLVDALDALKAFIPRDAFTAAVENRIAREATELSDDALDSQAYVLAQYLQFQDWVRIISRLNHDKRLAARDIYIRQFIYRNFDHLDAKTLKATGFPEDLRKFIEAIYKVLTGQDLPVVSPEAAKKEKDEKEARPAGHASPPPPRDGTPSLERQSGDRPGVKSPDTEAALKRD